MSYYYEFKQQFHYLFVAVLMFLSVSLFAEDVNLQNCLKPPILAIDYVTVAPKEESNALTWATIVEYDNTGFNVYRAEKDEAGKLINKTKLNAELIPAQENVDLFSDGAVYSFTDHDIDPTLTYYYMVEDVDKFGIHTLQEEAEFIVEAKPNKPPKPATSCKLYGVHDEALNDAVFFVYELDTNTISQIGVKCKGCDIESIDISATGEIFVASGDNTFGHPKGHLYRLTPAGELISVGNTGFNDISGLSFKNGVLYAFAKGVGLVTLDTQTGKGTLIQKLDVKLADLSWDLQGKVLYGVVGQVLWRYNPTTQMATQLCTNLPRKTEALEVLPETVLPKGLVLLGSHKGKTLDLYAFNINTCKTEVNRNIAVPYDDPEGLAMGNCVN